MNDWLGFAGALDWIQFGCVVAIVLLILERSVFYGGLLPLHLGSGDSPSALIRTGHWRRLRDQVYGRAGLLEKGILLLLDAQQNNRSLRPDTLSLWLEKRHQHLLVHLDWLKLLAIISPLIGLLGAVSVLNHALRELTTQDVVSRFEPLSSALLINEFKQGLLVISVGLIAAVLAMLFLIIFRLLTTHYMNRLEQVLTEMNLAISQSDRVINHYRRAEIDSTSQVWDAWELGR